MTASPNDDIKMRRLDNGITLVFEPMPWLRSLSMAFLLPIGSVSDPDGFEGSATTLSEWLGRGAGERDSRAFNDELDGLGVRRGGGAGRETTSVSISMLAQALPRALPLVADMIRRPRLDEGEFAGARELAVQELESLEDSPGQKLNVHLNAGFFTSAHRRSAYGTAEGLARLTPDSVRADYAARFAPAGMIIAAAGGADWNELSRLIEEQFGDWQGEPPPLPAVEVVTGRRGHVEQTTSQMQIGFAYPALAPTHDDWYKQNLALSVLSGGMGSRLFTEVREKRGLVYSVHAFTRALRGFGYILARAGTTPERSQETLDVMLAEFDRLARGVDDAELERARVGILSQLVMQGESSGSRASALVNDLHLRGEPRTLSEIRERVGSLTLDDVNSFLAGLNLPEPYVLTLGPALANGQ